MKRKEEIEKQAKEFIDNYMQSCVDYRSLGYHQRKVILNVDLYKVEEVYEEAANWADKTMLDRAENYLRSKFEYRPILKEEYIHGEDYIRHRQEQSRLCNEFITAFRQAMEGGAE